jgi:hypothetical protein
MLEHQLQLLSRTLLWASFPSTWIAVVIPAVVSVYFFSRHRVSVKDLFLMLSGVAFGSMFSRLVEGPGSIELHLPPVFSITMITLTGLRVYTPPAGKLFSMCWLVLLASDFIVMAGPPLPLAADVLLPLGIGGAGAMDALFVEPLVVALGALALHAARKLSKADVASIETFSTSARVPASGSLPDAPY